MLSSDRTGSDDAAREIFEDMANTSRTRPTRGNQMELLPQPGIQIPHIEEPRSPATDGRQPVLFDMAVERGQTAEPQIYNRLTSREIRRRMAKVERLRARLHLETARLRDLLLASHD